MDFSIRRGMNIGGWLSQSSRRGEERRRFFTREDAQKLAGLGFDHLRLPVDEEQLWDEQLHRENEAWELLNSALDWCDATGLRAVVDLHIVRSHYFNAPQRPLFTDPNAPLQFAQLWRDLSRGLRSRAPSKVAYELLNEAVADNPEDWNRVYPYPYRAIREAEAERVIVLGSNCFNQARTFEFLAVPEQDRQLILTFHFYEPMHVTHYRAKWVKECSVYDGPIQYPGLPIPQEEFNKLNPETQRLVAKWNVHYDRQVMKGALLWPLAVAQRTGLPLYCGEFGVIGGPADAIRDAWHRDFISVLEELKIAWANWSYKGGFGFLDKDGNATASFSSIMPRGS